VAARARLDLEDDVLVVAGVARDEEQAERLGELLALLLQLLDLGGEVGVVGGQFARGLDVVAGLLAGAVRGDDRGEFGVTLVQPARVGLVGVDRRVGELLLQGGVLGDEFLDGLEHLGLLRGAWVKDGRPKTPVPERPRPGTLPWTGEWRLATSWSLRKPCRSGPRSGPHGHRCRGSSACPCRTGGTRSRPRPGWCRTRSCCGSEIGSA